MFDKQEKIIKGERKHKVLWEIWSWIYSIVIAVVVVILIKNFLFSTTIVRKESMIPTLQEYNMLLVDRVSQIREVPLKSGDIVILEAPTTDNMNQLPTKIKGTDKAYYAEDSLLDKAKKLFYKMLYVKRVIAVGGDTISIADGVVYVNGEKIDEPYVNPENSDNGEDQTVLVPEGYVFCMGDNRGASMDCRYFGAVPVEKIEGRVICRFFPFNEIGREGLMID